MYGIETIKKLNENASLLAQNTGTPESADYISRSKRIELLKNLRTDNRHDRVPTIFRRRSGEMSKSTIPHVTEDSWHREVLKSSRPVVVDFYADWCGPCRYESPVLDHLAKELESQIKFVRLDVDKEKAVADEYKIQSIPTISIFSSGRRVSSISGVLSKAELKGFITKHALLEA